MAVEIDNAPAKPKGKGLRREIPQWLVAAICVIMVAGLGASGFYAFNGGWQTDGMKEDIYYHEVLPILQAGKGDPTLLIAENKRRKEQGRPLLVLEKKNQGPPSPEAVKLADAFKAKSKTWQGGSAR